MIFKLILILILFQQTTAKIMANISPADRIKNEKESVWLVIES